MHEITKQVYIEQDYPGVVLGAIALDKGLMLIDAPFDVKYQQAWQMQCLDLAAGNEKLLVITDTHLDRTVGLSTLEYKFLCHDHGMEILQNRSPIEQAEDIDVGTEWGNRQPPPNHRWPLPDMTFSKEMMIYWGDDPVVISHQPGSHLAGCWVRYDAQKVLFVGDSVVLNQPPFLAWADIDPWVDELNLLISERFKGYKIISARNGVVRQKMIEKLINFLTQLKDQLEELSDQTDLGEKVRQIVPKFMKPFSSQKEFHDLYTQRLTWGLEQYLLRHKTKAS